MTDPLDELAAVALVGVERRPPQTPRGAGAAGPFLDGLPWDAAPERALLHGAAALDVRSRAGVRAHRPTADPPARAPAETAPSCSPWAAALLDELLDDHELHALVPAWLEAVASRGERALPVVLPRLVAHAADDRALREPVRRVGGERLAWLAALDGAWAWAATRPAPGEDDAARWHTGEAEERLELLRDLRRTDPGRGRELVEATWSEDTPEQRAAFVEALREGLAPADDPVLERALSDRRREVRAAAADLLATLPGSGYRDRMAARLRPLVAVEGRLRRRLTVRLPGEPDAAAARDGLRARASGGLGARSAVLAEIVAGAGLEVWRELTDADPATVLRLAAGTDHAAALAAGWRRAAIAERDAAWAAAVMDARPGDAGGGNHGDVALALVAAEDAHYARDAIAGVPLEDLILRSPERWSTTFSAAIAPALAGRADELWRADAGRAVATRLHPSAVDTALQALSARASEDRRAVTVLVRLLTHRQTLLRELPTP